ncbi:MAG: tRNA 2-selenouridine(34) synthase MnmH [Tissierellia bacterium]|nr:tRNA 2-selenouridine(34) synthase MnmH [Tissierellia bacterium]
MQYERTAKEALELGNPLFVDLRSEGEYREATIPGAVNLPVLKNEERDHVGKVYVQESTDRAKELAVAYMAPKLPSYYNFLSQASQSREVVLFCARGGMRSHILFDFLRGLGHKVFYLKGGYKGYRKMVRQTLPELVAERDFVVLNGLTGVGKTEILLELKERGANILDLEGLAHHKGSLLGSIGESAQPSQKMFESLLLDELLKLPPGPIFVESESNKIGKLEVPVYLRRRYGSSPHQVLITAPMEGRVERLLKDYTVAEGPEKEERDREILEALASLSRHMGKRPAFELSQWILEGRYEEVARELMVRYYDKNYAVRKGGYLLQLEHTDTEEVAARLLQLGEGISKS